MIHYLPYDEFEFLTEKEIDKFDLDSISENSSIGYTVEVDLKYCDELHDFHSYYSLCPEKVQINLDMLSKYCSGIANKYGIKVGGVNKLVPNLRDKKYIVRYRNLQLYLKLGMKLTKVHRILKVKQSNWLKEHIEFNTEKRKGLKIISVKISGETMENKRKRINVKIINNTKDYIRCVNRPNFISKYI